MLSLLILYFIVPSIMCDDCDDISINVKGREIVQLLGDNTPMTSKNIDGNTYTCFNADLLTLSKCKIGTVEHCGLFFDANDCGDSLVHARDFYTFNNGDTILFGGIVSGHPMKNGADGSDIWDLATISFATTDNIIASSGQYTNVKGRRSLRGFIKINTDQTRGSINEYHTLYLRTNSKNDISNDESIDEAALMDINNNKDGKNIKNNNDNIEYI
eukprot:1002027_1